MIRIVVRTILLVALFGLYAPVAGDITEELRGTGEPVAEGVVTDAVGLPAGNVEILLEVSDMRIRREVSVERARTDIEGRFRFDLSKYEDIPRLGMQFETLSPRYRLTRRIVEADQEELPVVLSIRVEPGAVALGKVVDEEGRPVADVEVSAAGSRSVSTNAQGEFEIYGLHPTVGTRLQFFKPGYSAAQLSIRPEGPVAIRDLSVTMSSAADLQGIVLDPEGNPVQQARIYLKLGQRFHQTRPDEQGRFKYTHVPMDLSEATITVLTEEFFKVERPPTASELESREVVVRLRWPLVLEGLIRTPDGAPATGARVQVKDPSHENPLKIPVDSEGRWRATPLTPGARISVLALPASSAARDGLGELEFLFEEKPGRWKGEVNPWPEGFSSTYEAELNGKTLRMVRRDSGPRSLPGEVIYAGTVNDDFSEMTGTITVPETGAAGEFRARAYGRSGSLRGVWDLRERIGAGTPPHAPRRIAFRGAPFPGTQLLDIDLAPSLVLAGRVLDADGHPMTTGIVRVVQWEGTSLPDLESRIGAGGDFELKGLPEGPLEVVVLNEANRPVSRSLFLRGGLEGVEIRLGSEGEDPADPVALP